MAADTRGDGVRRHWILVKGWARVHDQSIQAARSDPAFKAAYESVRYPGDDPEEMLTIFEADFGLEWEEIISEWGQWVDTYDTGLDPSWEDMESSSQVPS